MLIARVFLIAALVVIALFVGRLALIGQDEGPSKGLTLPDLTAEQQAGRTAFAANCAACHGQNGVGTDQGPPLVHKIYEPSHHSDMSFLMAVRQGVRAHHWGFGDMPPQPQVSDDDVARIVAYVRAIQRANGIN